MEGARLHPSSNQLLLITLLVELGVAAAVASSLARSNSFKRLLLLPQRTTKQTLGLVAWICAPLMAGVLVRVRVANFLAADLSLATTALVSLVLGPGAGAFGALLLSLPALGHHEWLALPMNLVFATVFGIYGRLVDAENVWSFTPLIDLSIYRWVRRTMTHPHLDRQIFLLLTLMAVQLGASVVAAEWPARYFGLYSTTWWVEVLICACTPVVVGIPLKIWNAVRIERKLEEQGRLLLEARLEALQRQINPHFLFNTLNSIASLVRVKPELAREMIVKLANILRALLRDRDALVPLRDELAFTDDYLDIEVVRFGEKLRVVKEIAAETLDVMVPSMVLQPLIENSIKHGLEPRISGGTVTLRSRRIGARMILEVEDDGLGVDVDAASRRSPDGSEGSGIGMRNVRERVQVMYGDEAHVEMSSRPGRGTSVRLSIPVRDGAGASV